MAAKKGKKATMDGTEYLIVDMSETEFAAIVDVPSWLADNTRLDPDGEWEALERGDAVRIRQPVTSEATEEPTEPPATRDGKPLSAYMAHSTYVSLGYQGVVDWVTENTGIDVERLGTSLDEDRCRVKLFEADEKGEDPTAPKMTSLEMATSSWSIKTAAQKAEALREAGIDPEADYAEDMIDERCLVRISQAVS